MFYIYIYTYIYICYIYIYIYHNLGSFVIWDTIVVFCDTTHFVVWWICTDISVESTAAISRATYLLKVEAVCPTTTLVYTYKSTWCPNPAHCSLLTAVKTKNNLYRCTVHLDINVYVTNWCTYLLVLESTKIYLKFTLKCSYMFQSLTIIRELVLEPSQSYDC